MYQTILMDTKLRQTFCSTMGTLLNVKVTFLFQEAKLIFVEKWSFFVSFQIELHFLWFYRQIVDPKENVMNS